MDGLTALKLTATGLSGLFAGACFYGTSTEHPARMSITDTKSLHQQWTTTFNIAKKLQSSINLLATSSAVGVFYLDNSENRYLWLTGAGVFFLILPWTAIVMLPDINKLLKDDVMQVRGEKWVRDNIDNWNTRCHFRTMVGVAAFSIFMYGLTKQN